MKKTLGELLIQAKYQKTNVKIGSKSGSSFWYCGKGKSDYLMPELKKVQTKLYKQNKRTLSLLEHRLNNLDKIYEDNLNEAIKSKRVKNIKEYTKELEMRKEKERVLLPKRIKDVQYDIKTHLLDRPVKEIVYGICKDESPCWIVYVKGNEKGSYWTIAEYTHKVEIVDDEEN